MRLATMRRWLAGMFGLILGGCQALPTEVGNAGPMSLIPAPVSVRQSPGRFDVRPHTAVIVRSSDAELMSIARHFVDLVQGSRGLQLDVQSQATQKTDESIEFMLDPEFSTGSDDHDEGYELVVTPHRVALTARTPHGLFNGSITLWQLMTPDQSSRLPLLVPAVHIVDYPRFVWRGLLLDSARHFQSAEFVKHFIDEMALHKLNVLHWHLTDDQGWRVEIKRYPKLTEIGAWRAPQPNEVALVDPATGRYGGFYTQEQIRDVVRHAAARYVTIVPEIDMPGHAQAVVASYPEVGVTGRRPPVSSDWGINTYIYNVDESTFTFIDNVLSEVMDLFPSPYIHVGGDEAAKDQWQASPQVQQRMRRLGVRDEQALQGYFTARVQSFLHLHGRRLIGWDEILESGLPPGAVVTSWRGAEGAIAAARSGDDVIMSPDPLMYFDHLQGRARDEPPGRVKVISLSDVYAFEPVPRELDVDQARHVLGAQANLWSEYLTTPERVEYAAFPRAAALAERLWSLPERTAWNDFIERLPAQFDRYRALGIQYSDSAFEPQVRLTPVPALDKLQVTLTRQVDFGTIRYTLDGSAPGAASAVYQKPLSVKAGAKLRAATFADTRRLSTEVTRRVDVTSALRLYSDRLKTCSDSLLLRLEGAAEGAAPAPRYNVDLMNPCWIYPQMDFDTIARIDVRVGALPYFFELWHDTAKVIRRAPTGTADELQLRLDSCDGTLLAEVPLSAERTSVQTLSMPAPGQRGVHDVCVFFATRGRDPLRLIDWVEPMPSSR